MSGATGRPRLRTEPEETGYAQPPELERDFKGTIKKVYPLMGRKYSDQHPHTRARSPVREEVITVSELSTHPPKVEGMSQGKNIKKEEKHSFRSLLPKVISVMAIETDIDDHHLTVGRPEMTEKVTSPTARIKSKFFEKPVNYRQSGNLRTSNKHPAELADLGRTPLKTADSCCTLTEIKEHQICTAWNCGDQQKKSNLDRVQAFRSEVLRTILDVSNRTTHHDLNILTVQQRALNRFLKIHFSQERDNYSNALITTRPIPWSPLACSRDRGHGFRHLYITVLCISSGGCRSGGGDSPTAAVFLMRCPIKAGVGLTTPSVTVTTHSLPPQHSPQDRISQHRKNFAVDMPPPKTCDADDGRSETLPLPAPCKALGTTLPPYNWSNETIISHPEQAGFPSLGVPSDLLLTDLKNFLRNASFRSEGQRVSMVDTDPWKLTNSLCQPKYVKCRAWNCTRRNDSKMDRLCRANWRQLVAIDSFVETYEQRVTEIICTTLGMEVLNPSYRAVGRNCPLNRKTSGEETLSDLQMKDKPYGSSDGGFDIESISSYLDDATQGSSSSLTENSKRAIYPETGLNSALNYYRDFGDLGTQATGLYGQSYSSGLQLGVGGQQSYSVSEPTSLYGQEHNQQAGYTGAPGQVGALQSYNGQSLSSSTFNSGLNSLSQGFRPTSNLGAVAGFGQDTIGFGTAGAGYSGLAETGASGASSAGGQYSGGLTSVGGGGAALGQSTLNQAPDRPYQGSLASFGPGSDAGTGGASLSGSVGSPAVSYQGNPGQFKGDSYSSGQLRPFYKPSSYPTKVRTYVPDYKGTSESYANVALAGGLGRPPTRHTAYSAGNGFPGSSHNSNRYYRGSPYIGGPGTFGSSFGYSSPYSFGYNGGRPYGHSYSGVSPYGGRYVRGYKIPGYSSFKSSPAKYDPYSTLENTELYCDYPQSLKLKMASKRRTMFYKNKRCWK
ncbi:hypothetical protein AAG570_010855 [Ranatra chinensis]|uniref:Fibroin heavy chain n=1 Tax=Ranatra chinensis TaxID=642074 RepID=A0ABD0YJ25_9HEMI